MAALLMAFAYACVKDLTCFCC